MRISTTVDPEDPESPYPPRPLPAAPPVDSAWLQVLAFATIYLIWGSTYLGIRIAVRTLPPLLMAGCRFLLAGGALYAILRARGVRAPTRKEWARAGAAGVAMLTVGNGVVTWVEQRVPSNLAALMIAAVPLFTALLDWLRPGGQQPRPRTFLGIALGAAGMVFLMLGRGRAGSAEVSALGLAALLLSGFAWAAGSLYARYGTLHRQPLMVAAQEMLVGGSVLFLLALARGEPRQISSAALIAPSVLAFAYLTVMGSLVAFSAFGWLVKVSTPARLSTTAYVNPVVAVVLGWGLLGETLSPRALGGAALIVGAVLVMTLPSRRWG
jgi:drug/metabolite transporter (DMT)-like permease